MTTPSAGSAALRREEASGAEARAEVRPETDGELLGRARVGDERALAELVRRHRGRVERLARAVTGEAEAARDIAQEGFLKMLGSLEKLDPEQGLKAWLDRVVVNLAIDHLRRRRRQDAKDAGLRTETQRAAPEDIEDREELRERVYEVLEGMPTKYRTVLVLRDIEGREMGEIAQMVGRREGTVRWRLSEARRMFRRLWGKTTARG